MKATIEKITYTPSTIITAKNLKTCSKETRKAYAYFEKNKNIIFAPEKYLPSQKKLVLKKVQQIHSKNSETSLRRVLISVLNDLPDFLPGDNLLLVSGYVVEEWGRLEEIK